MAWRLASVAALTGTPPSRRGAGGADAASPGAATPWPRVAAASVAAITGALPPRGGGDETDAASSAAAAARPWRGGAAGGLKSCGAAVGSGRAGAPTLTIPALREPKRDKPAIADTGTAEAGRGQNRDKTAIACTLIGSQSPSRTADSSMVPRHYPHHYSRSVTTFSTMALFIGTIRKGHEDGRRRPRPRQRSPTGTTTPICTVIQAKTEPSPSPSTTGTPTNKHLAQTH